MPRTKVPKSARNALANVPCAQVQGLMNTNELRGTDPAWKPKRRTLFLSNDVDSDVDSNQNKGKIKEVEKPTPQSAAMAPTKLMKDIIGRKVKTPPMPKQKIPSEQTMKMLDAIKAYDDRTIIDAPPRKTPACAVESDAAEQLEEEWETLKSDNARVRKQKEALEKCGLMAKFRALGWTKNTYKK